LTDTAFSLGGYDDIWLRLKARNQNGKILVFAAIAKIVDYKPIDGSSRQLRALHETLKNSKSMSVPNRSRHFRVSPRDKGVMSTCRWPWDALLAGRSRRGNGNDGYCDAGPQAMRNCAEVELT